MKIHLLIGPSESSAARFRTLLKKKAMLLEKHGVYSPEWNHIRIYMACSDPDQVGVIRFKRGFESELAQKALYHEIKLQLTEALERNQAETVVLGTGQLGGMLTRAGELERLRDLLQTVSDDIQVTAYLFEQGQELAQFYANRVMEGRRYALDREFELIKGDSWWDGALAMRGENAPYFGLFNDIQYPPFWLDYARLHAHWGAVFGAENVHFRPHDPALMAGEDAANALGDVLGLNTSLGKVDPEPEEPPHSAASVTRVRGFNDLLIRYMQARDMFVPRDFWRQIQSELRIPGPPIDPGELHEISAFFKPQNDRLIAQFPALGNGCLEPVAPQEGWTEADPQSGYRASQYLSAFAHRIRNNALSVAEKEAEKQAMQDSGAKFEDILRQDAPDGSVDPRKERLIDMVKVNHQIVQSTQIRPHNNLGHVNEEELAAAYTPVPMRDLPAGNTGNIIVGCMKNEAPYIVEWVAYHRAIGVDNFLIYTNDCTDGTSEILDRLQAMGVLQHRNNDDWKGNSPQQHALNRALEEPVLKNAEWIIHIDVDEFINVRTGNGTLADFFAAAPGATNVAMTWRLFGHNGVERLADAFVIDQFDTCAPKYCPKPHTVWGFKTMFRNIGAYAKLSCHRPNKFDETFAPQVKWVNGSGKDMTREAVKNGWRNSKKTIGYDLIQLNHYALRSAESFLIKRQRGRALHVDRSIGLNYWIRMDWSDFRDITIKRNVPRLRAEYDRLMQDDTLRALHQKGMDWHRAKAEELHGMPEFEDLYRQALQVKLNETERVAYALALDMES